MGTAMAQSIMVHHWGHIPYISSRVSKKYGMLFMYFATHERVIKLETKFEVYEGLSKKSLTRP